MVRGLIFAAFATTVFSAPAYAGCQLLEAAKLEMTIQPDGRLSVPMAVNGHKLAMLIDTGGYQSAVTKTVAETLWLHKEGNLSTADRMYHPLAEVYGGQRIMNYTIIDELVIGTLKARQVPFLILSGAPSGIDGFLAPDIMRNYDVDFDFANSMFSLFVQNHCTGDVVYWTRDRYGRMPFSLDRDGHILLSVSLDGKQEPAMIDTGAARSVANLERIESDFGIDGKSPDLKPVSGIYAMDQASRYPFKTLAFGNPSDGSVTVLHPDLELVPQNVSQISLPAIILGMDVLRRLHLFIAYDQRALYVTSASAH